MGQHSSSTRQVHLNGCITQSFYMFLVEDVEVGPGHIHKIVLAVIILLYYVILMQEL